MKEKFSGKEKKAGMGDGLRLLKTLWLAAFALPLAVYCWFSEQIPLFWWGAGRTVDLFCCLVLCLHSLLMLLTGRVDWSEAVRPEDADRLDRAERSRYALKSLLLFLAALALFCWYCFGGGAALPALRSWLSWIPGATRDSIAAGTVICASALAACRLRNGS